MNLPPRYRHFVAAYLKTKSAKAAAIEAGYSPHTATEQGCRLLKEPRIKKELEKAVAKIEEIAGVNAAYVVTAIKEVAERCMQRIPVMEFDHEAKELRQKKDEDGKDIWEFDSAGANKALENLGKFLGIFIEKRQLSGPGGGSIKLEDLVAGSLEIGSEKEDEEA